MTSWWFPSVCPSIPPFILRSCRPIFKIIFLFERYDIRDLTFILFVRLSVCLPVRPFRTPLSISVPYPPFNFRSNRQISKILFLFERYNIRDISFILSVRPSVRTPFQFSFLPSDFQNSFFVWKVWHERPNFYTFCPSVCLSVRLSIRLFRTSFILRSYRPILKILFFCLKGMRSET